MSEVGQIGFKAELCSYSAILRKCILYVWSIRNKKSKQKAFARSGLGRPKTYFIGSDGSLSGKRLRILRDVRVLQFVIACHCSTMGHITFSIHTHLEKERSFLQYHSFLRNSLAVIPAFTVSLTVNRLWSYKFLLTRNINWESVLQIPIL
jgi:hypothetical protein